MSRPFLLLAGLALAGCATATTAEDKLSERAAERLAKYERTGEVKNCVSIRQVNSITPLDEYHFLVRTGVNRFYLNEVSRRCNGADDAFNRLQYEVRSGSLCRNEIIHVVDNSSGFTVGTCGLGSFQALTKKVEETE